MSRLFPIILAGGSGTRLWPLSRKNYPKQFLRLQGEFSLLQKTLQRALALPHEEIIVVSNESHYFLCQEQLQSFSTPLTYLLEPFARNTAPAIACAAHYIVEKVGNDALMVILPSDHWIGDLEAWQQAMLKGADYASKQDAIVTFGITPNAPETGYGYIEAASAVADGIATIDRFLEKPDLETAEKFLASGNYYWNSGMFIARAGFILEELANHSHDIFHSGDLAVKNAQHQFDYIRLDTNAFSGFREESIDYALMEKTEHAVVIPVNMTWSDLGCWSAVADANDLDVHGNAVHGKAVVRDSHDCLISSEDILVTTLGIRDQVIIATKDAVLVADKRYSQQVKEIVNDLALEYQSLAVDHQRVSRPWGFYEVLASGPTFKVKRLMIKPGAKLSLQMHQHRAEHWVVVEGTAEVINDDKVLQLGVNQSTYIPQKTRHRLGNAGTTPLFVIEVQSGSYLGEDDITRFDDLYHRFTAETAE